LYSSIVERLTQEAAGMMQKQRHWSYISQVIITVTINILL